jgi:hypothetical protein
LSVAAAAWKGPRPSDHNESSRRSRSIRRDDDDDGNHPPLVGYAKVFTTVEEKMAGSEGRGSSDTVESETWNRGSSRTPVLKGCKQKVLLLYLSPETYTPILSFSIPLEERIHSFA